MGQGRSLLVGCRVGGCARHGFSAHGDRRSERGHQAVKTDHSATGGEEVLLSLIQLLSQNVDVLLQLLNVLEHELLLRVDLRDDIVGVSHASVGVIHRA